MIKLFKKKSNINNIALSILDIHNNVNNIYSYHSVFMDCVQQYMRFSLIVYKDKVPLSDTLYCSFLLGNNKIYIKVDPIKNNTLQVSFLSVKPVNLWVKEHCHTFQSENDTLWSMIENSAIKSL